MSDNEYTPTEDDLRDGWMRACYYLDDGPDNDGSGAYRSGGPRFDRAIARIKAEARVAALREAAEEILAQYDEMGDPDAGWVAGLRSAAIIVRARADRIEQGGES